MQTTQIDRHTKSISCKQAGRAKQSEVDRKEYKLCGFRGTEKEREKQEQYAQKRRNKTHCQAKADIAVLREFNFIPRLKKKKYDKARAVRPQVAPQNPERYATTDILTCGDVESNPGPRPTFVMTCRKDKRKKFHCAVSTKDQVCPHCNARIFRLLLEGKYKMCHDFDGLDTSAYTRETARRAIPATEVAAAATAKVLAEEAEILEAIGVCKANEKGKEKEEDSRLPPSLPPRNASALPAPSAPIVEPGEELSPQRGDAPCTMEDCTATDAEAPESHAAAQATAPQPAVEAGPPAAEAEVAPAQFPLDGQRLSKSQLDEYALGLNMEIVSSASRLEDYVGERRLAPQRNVEELQLPIRISQAVMQTRRLTSFTLQLVMLSVVLFCDVVVFWPGAWGSNFLRSSALIAYACKMFQLVLTVAIRLEGIRVTRPVPTNRAQWILFLASLPQVAGLHIPYTCTAIAAIIYCCRAPRRRMEMQWAPHIVSILCAEFMFTPSNDVTLRQSLALRAKRLACLPLNDVCHCKWVQDSILLAEHLIKTQNSFSTGPESVANFVPSLDWT